MASLDDNPIQYWLAKSTNPLNTDDDAESIKQFCDAVNKVNDGPTVALRLIGHKIQSPQEREALQGLTVLENCVKLCDYRFHQEIGKFRFLNEMVKVVSPKYLGLQTSAKVKKKIVELLYEWMITLKNEPKIGEAYHMLKKQGVVVDDPVYVEQKLPPVDVDVSPRPRNAVFEDQEKSQLLHKLLQSKNPEDLEAANRLIKSMVKEDEKKSERMSKRMTELETAAANIKVLGEMLDHVGKSQPSPEELDLMKELYDSCDKLRPALFRLASEIEDDDQGIADILKANDEITAVMTRYKHQIEGQSIVVTGRSNETSLLELSSPIQEYKPDASLLDDQLLGLGIGDKLTTGSNSTTRSLPNTTTTMSESNVLSTMDQLTDVFSHESSLRPSHSMNNKLNNDDSNLLLSTPLEPCVSGAAVKNDNLMESSKSTVRNSRGKAFEGLDELVKHSLPTLTTGSTSFPQQPAKIPMNKMQKKVDDTSSPTASVGKLPERMSPSHISVNHQRTVEVAKETNVTDVLSNPNHMLDDAVILSNPVVPTPLDDLSIGIQSIKPASIDPLTLFDKDGVSIVIHFASNKPRDDVNVMVVTILNKSSSQLTDVKFSANVTSDFLIRLQEPSGHKLPAFNPILPPGAITIVVLVSNPKQDEIVLAYELSYKATSGIVMDKGTVTCPLSS